MNARRLYASETIGMPIGWSRNGEAVYVVDSEPPRVLKLSTADGHIRRVARMPWNPSSCHTVDGDQFVCAVEETESDVWFSDLDPETG